MPEDIYSRIELSKYRLERAKITLNSAINNLQALSDYATANNRAYYSIFYGLKAVLALENIDFNTHKEVIGYFNKNYVHTGLFDNKIGSLIHKAEIIRNRSDYNDFYIFSREKTIEQIESAKEIYSKIEGFVEKRINELSFSNEEEIQNSKIKILIDTYKSFIINLYNNLYSNSFSLEENLETVINDIKNDYLTFTSESKKEYLCFADIENDCYMAVSLDTNSLIEDKETIKKILGIHHQSEEDWGEEL